MEDIVRRRINEEKNMMIEVRRYLHKHPEPSFREIETTNYIMEKLEGWSIPYQAMEPTGLIAEIKGKHPGLTVALRADIDAMEMEEKNELVYRSKYKGLMHASGHDAHTAMLLTAAKILNEMKSDLYGKVRLIFQPAEVILSGAKSFVEQGVLEGVNNIFGLHIWSGAPSGSISCPTGPYFASADNFRLKFYGESGHAAQPQRCVDATIMMAQYINDIQTIVSRYTRATSPLVISVGRSESGKQANVISGEALLEGTVRSFDNKIRDEAENRMQVMAEKVAEMHGGRYDFDYQRVTDPLVNDGESAQMLREMVKEYFGEEAYEEMTPTTISDDFSYYLSEIPGTYATVGASKDDLTSYPHHSDHFNIDEEAMTVGAELHVRYALEYLRKQKIIEGED